MTKKILLLKASKDVCGNEINLIKNHCELLGMVVFESSIGSYNELQQSFAEYETKNLQFDYIYLCTHGNTNCFLADMSGHEEYIKWADFSSELCIRGMLSDSGIVLLACCKGGFSKVAYDIFACCNTVNYICGIKWSIAPWDITTGFVVFIHNMETKKAEPRYAALKASQATDYTFHCYDRDEIETNPAYYHRAAQLFSDLGWVDDNGEWVESDPNINKYADKDVLGY